MSQSSLVALCEAAPAGAKARDDSVAFSKRLKSCPDTKPRHALHSTSQTAIQIISHRKSGSVMAVVWR